jgi:hypothetical protein
MLTRCLLSTVLVLTPDDMQTTVTSPRGIMGAIKQSASKIRVGQALSHCACLHQLVVTV